MGLAMPLRLARQCPDLCSRLWMELDIIPLALPEEHKDPSRQELTSNLNWDARTVDEQAESLGRKCVRSVFLSPSFNCTEWPLTVTDYLGPIVSH